MNDAPQHNETNAFSPREYTSHSPINIVPIKHGYKHVRITRRSRFQTDKARRV